MSLHWAASATTTLTLNWPLRKTVWQAVVAYPYSLMYVHLCAGACLFIMLELDPSLSFLSLCAVCTDLAIFHLLNVGLKKED